MEIPSSWREKLLSAKQRLEKADQVTSILANLALAGGGPIAKAVSVAAIASNLIDMFVDDIPISKRMEEEGYRPLNISVTTQKFIVTALGNVSPTSQRSTKDEHRWQRQENIKIEFYEDFAFVLMNDDISSMWIRRKVTDEFAALHKLVGEKVWEQEENLELVSDEKVYLQVMPQLNPYVGIPTPGHLANMLRTEDGEHRIIAVCGGSGSGKSLLACLASEKIHGRKRLLKLDAQVGAASIESDDSSSNPISSILEIVRIIRPDVLLLDDVQSWLWGNPNARLAVLESLKRAKVTTVLSVMNESIRYASFNGARPERIDDWLFILPPDPDKRREVFRLRLGGDYKFPKWLIPCTRGMTPAWLVELAKRINRGRYWRREVQALRLVNNSQSDSFDMADSINLSDRIAALESIQALDLGKDDKGIDQDRVPDRLRGTPSTLAEGVAKKIHSASEKEEAEQLAEKRVRQLFFQLDLDNMALEVRMAFISGGCVTVEGMEAMLVERCTEMCPEKRPLLTDAMIKSITEGLFRIAYGPGWQEDYSEILCSSVGSQ